MARIVSILHDCSTVRTPLLIEGEMGTGKAFLVRAFHADHCASPDAPIVGMDCSTLGRGTDGEEELDIAWAQAANGILFLVDFDSLPTSLQTRLFDANDGTRARIVGTTRQALIDLQRAGRLDLRNFDINGGRILSMPPLRHRTDFAALVRQFLSELAPDTAIQIHPDALALLNRHRWPGNVRELRNQLRVILALLGDETTLIDPSAIPEELFDSVIDPTR
jgi:transcriptional regulator of acetoin/glycerol metabolism